MAKKPSPKPKDKPDKEQAARFIETARQLSADETGEEFSKAIERVLPSKGIPNGKG